MEDEIYVAILPSSNILFCCNQILKIKLSKESEVKLPTNKIREAMTNKDLFWDLYFSGRISRICP